MGGTSRVSREAQARICEGLGVKFPGPTRPRGEIPRADSASGSHRKVSPSLLLYREMLLNSV